MTAIESRPARSIADLNAGVILASVDIAATPARVFCALTDPTQILEWWGSPDSYRTEEWSADLRVGGQWRARGRMADGSSYALEGAFLEVDPPRKLVQTWAPDWEPGLLTTLTYRLEPIEGGTRVTVRHEGFSDHPAACQGHTNGWELVLGWLREYSARSHQKEG